MKNRRIVCAILALALLATTTPAFAAPAWGSSDDTTNFISIFQEWVDAFTHQVGQLRPDRLGAASTVNTGDLDGDAELRPDRLGLRPDRLGLRPDRLGSQAQ